MENNIELLKRAKNYIEALANGIDPIIGDVLQNETILNNVKISRCLFFVSGVLKEVIDNGGQVMHITKKAIKIPFSITPEQKAKIELSTVPLQITEFVARINAQIDECTQGKIPPNWFTTYLVEEGYLTVININGNKHKEPTDAGKKLGIITEWVDYLDKHYARIKYDENAQRFLLDNLDEVINLAKIAKGES